MQNVKNSYPVSNPDFLKSFPEDSKDTTPKVNICHFYSKSRINVSLAKDNEGLLCAWSEGKLVYMQQRLLHRQRKRPLGTLKEPQVSQRSCDECPAVSYEEKAGPEAKISPKCPWLWFSCGARVSELVDKHKGEYHGTFVLSQALWALINVFADNETCIIEKINDKGESLLGISFLSVNWWGVFTLGRRREAIAFQCVKVTDRTHTFLSWSSFINVVCLMSVRCPVS